MCAVQMTCLCAERPTDAHFAGALCEEQITVQIQRVPWMWVVLALPVLMYWMCPDCSCFAGTVAVTNIVILSGA